MIYLDEVSLELFAEIFAALTACERDFAGDEVRGDDTHSEAVRQVRAVLAKLRDN